MMHPMQSELTPFERAIRAAGSQTQLATGIGVTQQTISNWLHAGRKIPAEAAVAIERVSGVPRHELRPDLYEAPRTTQTEVGQ